jgi:hypothetical protein
VVIALNPSKNLKRPVDRDTDVTIIEHPGPEAIATATPSGRMAALNRFPQSQT